MIKLFVQRFSVFFRELHRRIRTSSHIVDSELIHQIFRLCRLFVNVIGFVVIDAANQGILLRPFSTRRSLSLMFVKSALQRLPRRPDIVLSFLELEDIDRE